MIIITTLLETPDTRITLNNHDRLILSNHHTAETSVSEILTEADLRTLLANLLNHLEGPDT